jgi:nucleotide-binding universal stress UspA family protein
MVKHILVATDGSDGAAIAVEMAARVAQNFGAKLTVLHVLLHGSRAEEASRLAEAEHLVRHVSATAMPDLANVPATMVDLFRSAQSNEETARIISALGDRITEDAAARARELGVADVNIRVQPGDYAETILNTATEIGADMIVLGSRGLGELKGLLPIRGNVLGFHEFQHALMAAFAAEAGLLGAAEGRGRVGHQSAVQPDHAVFEPSRRPACRASCPR